MASRGSLGEQAPEQFEPGGFGDHEPELTSAGSGRGGFGDVLNPAPEQAAQGGLDERVAGPESERLELDRFGRAAESAALGVERDGSGEQGSEPASAGPDADPLGGRTSEPMQSDLGGLDRPPPARHESDAEKTSIFASFQQAEPLQRAEPEPPRHEAGSLFAPASEHERGSLPGSLFDPNAQPEPSRGYASQAEPEHSYGSHAAAEEEAPAYAFGEPETTEEPGKATESTAILPKRQPRSTPRSSFEPPRPSMRSIERREPVADEGGRSGSLFEPTVRPNSAARGAHAAPEPAAPTPPPARTHLSEDTPPGPFGPGSAMPRPGGGRPSEEYTVKASVTALRYCTEDSPQFTRMVAEVWFRSVADAERVGFRSLSS
nr:hypothetical protein [Amycolatopsis pithecellobii]